MALTRSFRPHGHDIRMELEPFEVDLLRRLRDELREVLEGGDADGPILQRLFPACVIGDDNADQEVRRLLYLDLMQSRIEGLEAVGDILDRGESHRDRLRVDLVDDEPMLVLGVLNDLRITIGIQANMDEIERDDLGPDDPLQEMLAVMDHFGMWQEQLLQIIDPESLLHYDDNPVGE